ncbi:dihydrolipoyl dehydrogenase family protein [Aliiroseovarius sp. PTFE2010]|uniref:dihydrolipoyl dehydrogenase family protein n=1 Tax=Aliiroseovarius sp. PTFE2010 TaxID=3417190 RepID=UPI003CF65301
MKQTDTDICVIGAGSGGLSVAAGAVQMGARVVLIEGGRMGGDCLNYGCVPSKALLAAAKQAHVMRSGGAGIAGIEPAVDYAKAMAHVSDTIAHIAPVDSQQRFEELGCTVLRDYASFVSGQEVQASDTIVKARRFVIATGSSPLVPPIDGLDGVPYLTNETLFDLREAPSHLLILGGGPIGMEMAQAHQRLGCDVTVIEGDTAMNREDPEAVAVVLDALRREGVSVAEGAMAERVSGDANAVTVHTKDGRAFDGTHLLVALGRRPNIGQLNLEAAGVDTSSQGITVGDDLRTTNRRIYAIGDVAGRGQFTHLAGYHASTIIRPMLFGLPAKAKQAHIPRATYTDPELAQVGMTESEARAAHGDIEIARFATDENDRAIATGKTAGFIKVVVHKGRPVGATIVGADAGELIALWSLALSKNLKMSDVAGMVAAYPTRAELGKRAAGAYFSPRLFERTTVKRIVGAVQRVLP